MDDEPQRMLEQPLSPREKALLREGRFYEGPAGLRDHTLAAMGLAGSAGLATTLFIWAAKGWTTKALLLMSTATLLVAGPVVYVALSHPPELEPSSSAPAPGASPTETMSPPAPPEAEAPAPSLPPAVAAPAPVRVSALSASSALNAELAALDTVRTTLANKDAAGALSFLDAYFRTYPHGRLRLEAEVLRVDAMVKAGRTDEAKGYAQDFLKRHPNSVLASRLRRYVDR
jgi:hypothetical protein